MICYQFDASGYYTGEIESTVLPSGSTLLPPNSVTEKPPKQKKGCRLRWTGLWINEVIPPEFVPEPVEPEPEPTLEELKEKKSAEIAEARYNEETGGCDWSRKSDGKTYKIDSTDRGCLKLDHARTLAIEAGEAYQPQLWKTFSGWIQATLEDLTDMGLAVGVHVQKCFNKEAELMLEINKATTKEELDLIVWEKVTDIKGNVEEPVVAENIAPIRAELI